MFKTKKFFVVFLELGGGLSLALVALCLPLPNYFGYTLALLAVVAFCSSTHDIAADGLYIASLSPKEQAAYTGWQGGFYNAARFFSQGGLIILAGFLELRLGVPRAWMAIFAAMGLILMALSIYHAQVLPSGGAERRSESVREVAATFREVVVSFLEEAEHPPAAALHRLVPRRRGPDREDRPAVPGGSAGGGRPGPDYGPVRNHLRHVRNGGLRGGQHSGRLLHFLAGPAARAAAAGLRHEFPQPGLRVPEHGAADEPPADHRRRCAWRCSATASASWA